VQQVLVPRERFERWVANFAGRHGGSADLARAEGGISGLAPDGSTFSARLPFGATYGGVAEAADFARAVVPPADWGVLLVRKGGFAVARLAGERLVESKVGQRHVQGSALSVPVRPVALPARRGDAEGRIEAGERVADADADA